MSTAVSDPHPKQPPRAKKLSARDWEASIVDWPYALDRQPDGTWLALNRNYKPLGERGRDWVDYASHPARMALDGLTRDAAVLLSIDPITGPTPDRIYLYSDCSTPRLGGALLADYLEKLALCLSLGIEIPDSTDSPLDVHGRRKLVRRRFGPKREVTELDVIREAARKPVRSYWRAAPQWKGRFQ